MPSPATVHLAVYDVRGRLIRELGRGIKDAGEHAVAWDSRDSQGRRLPAGTYFGKLRVTAGGKSGVKVRKIIILH